MASNASEVISESEDQPRHSLRESVPNVRIGFAELNREQWLSIGHERDGFESEVTVRYDAYGNKRLLEDLKGLEEPVQGAFQKFEGVHDRYVELTAKAEPNKVVHCKDHFREQYHKLISQGRSQECCLGYQSKEARSSEPKEIRDRAEGLGR